MQNVVHTHNNKINEDEINCLDKTQHTNNTKQTLQNGPPVIRDG